MQNHLRKLLYIHNQAFNKTQNGSLNTTILQVFSMCQAFSQNGMEVTLYMEGADGFSKEIIAFQEKAFGTQLSFRVCFWKRKHSNNQLNRFLIQRNIRAIIKSEKPDLIFVRDPALLRSVTKFSTPVIFEAHSRLQHTRSRLMHSYLEREIKKASQKDNLLCLFSISKELSKHWEVLKIPGEKLFHWHDGFDERLFENVRTKTEARLTLNLSSDKTYVTYTGGLYENRGIENLLQLAQAFNGITFLIIGGPDENAERFRLIARENNIENIRFIGFVDHSKIPEYLFASDVLLAIWSKEVSTINYCSPLKLFEYMAAGRTILTHDFPTIREVLDDETAVFCKPDSMDDLKTKLAEAIEKKDQLNFTDKTREKAFTFYTWDKRVKKLLNFVAGKVC